ncbi:uncharacterized protein [Branchiostoma lanceolatum]|uniref:uncharacterized protein n=1 Tax=Branchiostoma lanceolatum TaxID=7740 RepID=UPI003456E694
MADIRLLTVAMTIVVIGTAVCTTCRDEGKKGRGGEIIVDEEGFKNHIEPLIWLQAEEIPDLDPNLHKRTSPKWDYRIDRDKSRRPENINVADCLPSRCKKGKEVRPWYSPRLVACAFTDEDGVRKYRVQRKQFPVACTCVRAKVKVKRQHNNNREGRRKSTKRRNQRRRGGME